MLFYMVDLAPKSAGPVAGSSIKSSIYTSRLYFMFSLLQRHYRRNLHSTNSAGELYICLPVAVLIEFIIHHLVLCQLLFVLLNGFHALMIIPCTIPIPSKIPVYYVPPGNCPLSCCSRPSPPPPLPLPHCISISRPSAIQWQYNEVTCNSCPGRCMKLA